MNRGEILDAAKRCVCNDRQDQYGNPEANFARTAAMWAAYKGVEFSPEDVAAMMILVKVSRIAETPAHLDNWIDAAGYAANGGEIVTAKPSPAEFIPLAPGTRLKDVLRI